MTDLITAWSFSRWETYEQCPLLFKLKYIDKLPTPGSAAMDRGSAIHKIGENYVLAKKQPAKVPPEYANFTEELQHIRDNDSYVEQEWGYKRDFGWTGRQGWFGADVWFRAKADVAVLYDDATLLLGDWKTGKKYYKNELQVELFSLAGYKRFEEQGIKEVDTRLWYLDAPENDNEIQLTFKAAEMPSIAKDWEKRTKAMFADRRFAPRPNDKCVWCHFSKAKGGPCKF